VNLLRPGGDEIQYARLHRLHISRNCAMLAVALTPVFAVRRWVRYRRNMQALGKLDDRMLRDIGLIRSVIQSAAWTNAR
jgi:uncharacterized protein YjiS (DUF1127 family)